MVLVVLLVALPVAAMTVGATVIRSNSASEQPDALGWFEAQNGLGADVVVPGTDDLADATLPEGWTSWASEQASVPLIVDGGLFDAADPPWVNLIESSDQDRFGRLVDGSAPASVGEITVDAEFARKFDLAVGDTVDARYLRPLSVVGIRDGRGETGPRIVGVDLPFEAVRSTWKKVAIDTNGDEAGIGPFLNEQAEMAGLTPSNIGAVGVAPGVPAFEVLGSRFGGETVVAADQGDAGPLAINWMLGVIGLGVVGIIIAAAFAAGTARQVVTSGQLLANGASPGVVRRVLALQGTWAGLVGAALGIGAGVGLVRLFLERSAWAARNFTEIVVWVIRPLDLVVIGVTGVVAATIAALVPARLLARIPVLSALAGRRPVRPAPRRLVPIGLVASAFGVLLLVTSLLASRTGSATWPAGLTGGLGGILVVVGMIGISPVVIRAAAGVAARLGPSWRLAARSIDRNRFRSTAVVAVVGVALTVAVAISAVAIGSIDTTTRTDLAWIDNGGRWLTGESPEDLVDLPAPTSPAWIDEVRDEVSEVIPDAEVIDLRYVVTDPPPRRGDVGVQRLLIADPAVLDRLELTDESVALLDDVGAIQMYGDSSPMPVTLEDESGPISLDVAPAAMASSRSSIVTDVLVTPERADDLGLAIITDGLLVDGTRTFTDRERSALRALGSSGWSAGDYYVDAGPTGQDDQRWVDVASPATWTAQRAQLFAALVALAVAGLVVAIGLSLTSAEGRSERAVLAALGAAPSTRRRTSAAQAALLTLIAAVLAVPTALVPLKVIDIARVRTGDWSPGDHLIGMPWLTVLAVVGVLPLAAGAGAWLVTALATMRDRQVPVARLALD